MTQPLSPVTDTDLLTLAETLEQWVEAIRAPNNAELTLVDMAYLNGECVSDSIELAVKALRRHAQSTPWQPIETAPKDGTRILVGVKDRYPKNTYVARWLKDVWSIGPLGGEWHAYPTHWMPIPALTSTHSSPPPVEPSPQGRPSGSGLKDGSGGGEASHVTSTEREPLVFSGERDPFNSIVDWAKEQTETVSSTDSAPHTYEPDHQMMGDCRKCGLPQSEHHYNGAAYGVCGLYAAAVTRPDVGP